MTIKRVLITCVGSGIGQSVVDSLKCFKDEYFLVGSDQSRFSYSVPDCDEFITLPQIAAAAYLDELLAACAAQRVDVVIPGHDLELPLFARHRERFDSIGVQVMVGSAPLVVLLRNKLAWAREFRKRTTRVVPTSSIVDFRRGVPDELIGLPAIAKPGGGSASSGLRIIQQPEEAAELPDDYVIQPFLFPADADPELAAIRAAVAARTVVQLSEISVQLIYSRDGELLGRFASRNRLKGGVPVEITPIDTMQVWSAVEEVAAVLSNYEPRGPINLQGRITSDGLIFFEMNPRFTGITGNRAQFGFNEVALLVDNFVDGTKRRLRVNPNKVGVRQVACRSWPVERYHFGRTTAPTRTPPALIVLGATSWLGRHFVADRAAAGHPVAAICREQSMATAAGFFSGIPNVTLIQDGSASLKDVFAWGEVLVNFASGRPPHGVQSIYDAHVYQTHMLDMAEIQEVSKIVNISSQSVYAAGEGGAKAEDAPLDASEPYAFSKCAIENAVRAVARRRPAVRAVSLRLARLFGAVSGLRESEFPHHAVATAVSGGCIEVRGPSNVLNLIDVRDAVRAVSFFVEQFDARWRGDVFNVGCGKGVTLAEYVDLVDTACRRRLGHPLPVTQHDVPTRMRSSLDCAKLSLAGWTPSYTLEQSVADLFEYFINARA
jgi:nucleoside-diphosphate-sugar epimerase